MFDRVSHGKRLFTDCDGDVGIPPVPRSHKSPRIDNHSSRNEPDACFSDLPEDIQGTVLSYLDVNSLVSARTVNRWFLDLASRGSSGWGNLCMKLWETKVHVSSEVTSNPDAMAAYKLSIEDAEQRDFIRLEELLFDPSKMKGTVWSFRFKESAGGDWTTQDPWYSGEACRKMVFLNGGIVKEFIAEDTEGRVTLLTPKFGSTKGNLVDPPVKMGWRFVNQPLGFPAKPTGSYLRFSVAGREVPTYCVHRSPTSNWGFIMESCWGVYASFELPRRPPRSMNRRRCLRRAQDAQGNWFNIEIDASDDSDSDSELGGAQGNNESRLLVDDDSFEVSNLVQWREASLYNFGSRSLPEGEAALEEFDRMYTFGVQPGAIEESS